MKSINILSRDLLYAEMLALELTEAGYNAVAGRTSLPDLIIIDLDSVDAVQGLSALTFSRDKEADIRRPFDVEDFLNLVESKLNSKATESISTSKEIYVSENERYTVCRNERIDLSELEHKLLLLLYKNRGTCVSTEEISKTVFTAENNPNLVRVYINYLREKLDKCYDIRLIETVRGKGYRLRRVAPVGNDRD